MLCLSAGSSVAYLVSPKAEILPAVIAVKGLSIALLALVAIAAGRQLLGLALLLSCCGDVLLACGNQYFVAGLALFLCAHLVYIAIFARHGGGAGNAAGRLAFPALLLLYGVGFGAWLAPALGALRLPVFAYIGAILAMTAMARRAGYRSRWVVCGAVLFLISDSLLGAGRFKTAVPLGGLLVWTTYYAGQCAIALGVLAEPEAARRA